MGCSRLRLGSWAHCWARLGQQPLGLFPRERAAVHAGNHIDSDAIVVVDVYGRGNPRLAWVARLPRVARLTLATSLATSWATLSAGATCATVTTLTTAATTTAAARLRESHTGNGGR